MRIVLGIVILLHGAVHIIGFASAWQLRSGLPHTNVLGGRVELGSTGARVVGVFWLALVLAFVIVAIGAFANTTWWVPAAYGATTLSLVLCLAELPQARVGFAVNGVIIMALMAMPKFLQ